MKNIKTIDTDTRLKIENAKYYVRDKQKNLKAATITSMVCGVAGISAGLVLGSTLGVIIAGASTLLAAGVIVSANTQWTKLKTTHARVMMSYGAKC